MNSVTIQKYVTLRHALIKEKADLEKRLHLVNEALSESGPATPAKLRKQRTRPRKLVKNPMSLRAAIKTVTKAKPLTKSEILVAIKKLGYAFNTTNPLGSLNSVLYSKRQFKNADGKFSPA